MSKSCSIVLLVILFAGCTSEQAQRLAEKLAIVELAMDQVTVTMNQMQGTGVATHAEIGFVASEIKKAAGALGTIAKQGGQSGEGVSSTEIGGGVLGVLLTSWMAINQRRNARSDERKAALEAKVEAMTSA